jgi:hypothetical protein
MQGEVSRRAQSLDHRPQRKGLSKRVAPADEQAAALELRARHQLRHQAALADAGLALDQRH